MPVSPGLQSRSKLSPSAASFTAFTML